MTQKVALVTGGASGIGKSTAMILARKGINVVISGRREDVGKKAVEEIRSQGGGDAALFAAIDALAAGADEVTLFPVWLLRKFLTMRDDVPQVMEVVKHFADGRLGLVVHQ